jgi:hypothetical protein
VERVGRPRRAFGLKTAGLVKADDWDEVLRALELREGGWSVRRVATEMGWPPPFTGRLLKRWGHSAGAFKAHTVAPGAHAEG